MPKETYPRDRFDEVPAQRGRIGVHRAENPRMRGGVVFLWALAATLILVAAGVFGTLVASGRIDLTPDPVATPTPEATVEPVVDTTFDVLVLNATPVEGLATKLGDEILAAGWTADQITASGAGTQDFRTTTVYYVDPADEAAAAGLAGVIGGAEIELSDAYPPSSPDRKQLTVVIGLDRVTTPSPTPTG